MNENHNLESKNIALDEVSRKFLCSLRERRKRAGLTQKVVADYVGLKKSAISNYEQGRKTPSLRYLLKLAEILKYDLSESINYKIFHEQVELVSIKRQLKFFGLTYPELEKLTGYSVRQITSTLNFNINASVRCLSAIMEVLAQEQKTYDYMYGAGRRKKQRL